MKKGKDMRKKCRTAMVGCKRSKLNTQAQKALCAKHRKENVDSSYEGVVLLQMLEDRLLKAEVFPGKTSDEIENFTSKATVYER